MVIKDTTPPRVSKFEISQFFYLHHIISTQTTYFNKKLRTSRRFTKSESEVRFVQFFLHTLYNTSDHLVDFGHVMSNRKFYFPRVQ